MRAAEEVPLLQLSLKQGARAQIKFPENFFLLRGKPRERQHQPHLRLLRRV